MTKALLGKVYFFDMKASFGLGRVAGLTPKQPSPIKFLVICTERNSETSFALGKLRCTGNEHLQQIIQLAKIIEVVLQCNPVVQLLLLALSVWEVRCGKEAGK